MTSRPPVILLAGPTASGKTALALSLAEAIGGEIVNADAIQLYRDLRVLSARPTAAEEARAPHHLFGVADAADGWSVGRWLAAAAAALEEIAGRKRPAIVAGGTGLYFHALTRGLAEVPAVPAAVREGAAADFAAMDETAFRERLAGVDPAAAARIAPGDAQRLKRAWEVFAASGRSLSDWQEATPPGPAGERYRAVVLDPPRELLYARCDARFDAMVAAGALDEVAALTARGLDPALPAMKATGLRELASCLAGALSLDEALALGRRETRRYAKRQLTWLRNQTPDWPRIAALDFEGQWAELQALEPGAASGVS
jgi:tRNA dimethylallyltransferase